MRAARLRTAVLLLCGLRVVMERFPYEYRYLGITGVGDGERRNRPENTESFFSPFWVSFFVT